jgi:hypothetical protein
VYKNVRDIARNTLERLLKRYTALAPAALPPVLLAVSGALSGVSAASTSCRWSHLPSQTSNLAAVVAWGQHLTVG